MRARLNTMLFTALAGPVRSLKARKGPEGTTQLTPNPRRGTHAVQRFRKAMQAHIWDNPDSQLETPVMPWFKNAPCNAWTAADGFYSRHQDLMREPWRHAITLNGISPYDLWMKAALPHFLRGRDLTTKAPLRCSVHLRFLRSETDNVAAVIAGAINAAPPDYLKTNGLHFACFRAAAVRYEGPDPSGETPPPGILKLHLGYESRIYTETYIFDAHYVPGWEQLPQKPQTLAFVRAKIYGVDAPRQVVAEMIWEDAPTMYGHQVPSDAKPQYAVLEHAPPVLGARHGIKETRPDLDHVTRVWWLTLSNIFASWPQWLPSKKGDTKEDITPWEGTHPEKLYYHKGHLLPGEHIFYVPL